MPDYAALLRGVNLGPHRRVSGAELRSLFEGIGFRNVATFRASGNVVFGADLQAPRRLISLIETHLAQSAGFEVAVFLRTGAQIRATADHTPFDPDLVDASQGKLQVAFLSRRPGAGARNEALALATADDRLALTDRELYWLPSGSIRDSALNFKAIEGLLGPTTMRTKGTIDQLAAKYFAG